MDFEVCTKAPESWSRMTIDDVCTRITSGGTPSRRNPVFFVNGSVPWVKTQELQDGWIRATEEQITEDAVKSSSAKLLPARTVLLAMYGATVGQLGVLASPMACNQACCALIVNDKIADFRYVYYLLLQHREVIKSLATGAAQQNLSAAQIKQFKFVFPDRQAQGHVADVLSGLDDKIALNRRINQTLEAMAQAIFKSWFVDFDPVKAKIAAKQEGRDPLRAAMSAISGKPDAELDALPPEQYDQLAATAALFPDEMEESGFGEIPKGWVVESLGEFLTIKRGGSPRPIQEFMAPSGLPWVKIADATAEASPFLFETREFIKESGLKKTVHLKSGALVLTNSATPGLPKFLDIDACIHDGWLYFPEKRLFTDQYLYFLFQKIRSELVAQGNGSVFTNLKTDILRGQQVLVPTHETMTSFTILARSILENIKALAKEGGCLASLRDTLLPKLLSGELSVTEAMAEAQP